MPDFPSIIPQTHVKASQGFVDALIQTQREELFSGLMRLHYPSGENLVFTFLNGVQQKLYRCLEKNMEVIPRQSWAYSLDRPDASIALMGLSLEGMRLMRVVYEAPIVEVQQLKSNSEALVEHTHLWSSDLCPGIVHIQSENIDRVYLMAGNAAPIIEELSVTGNKARFSLSDASFPLSLPRAEYTVTRYVSDGNHDVWQEFELRFAMHLLMRMLLNRFSELAGRVLTERLCEQLSLWLRDGGWNLNVTLNGVSNQQYFESLDSATSAYLEIIKRFSHEAGPAIGLRMADGIARDILLKMDTHRQELLKRHVYDMYGSQNAIARVGR